MGRALGLREDFTHLRVRLGDLHHLTELHGRAISWSCTRCFSDQQLTVSIWRAELTSG